MPIYGSLSESLSESLFVCGPLSESCLYVNEEEAGLDCNGEIVFGHPLEQMEEAAQLFNMEINALSR